MFICIFTCFILRQHYYYYFYKQQIISNRVRLLSDIMRPLNQTEVKKKFLESYRSISEHQYGNLFETHYHVKKYPLEKVYSKNNKTFSQNKSSYQILFNKNLAATIHPYENMELHSAHNKNMKSTTRQIYRPLRQKYNLLRFKQANISRRHQQIVESPSSISKNKSYFSTVQQSRNIFVANRHNQSIQQSTYLSKDSIENGQSPRQQSQRMELHINKLPIVRKKQPKRKRMLDIFQKPQLQIQPYVRPTNPKPLKKKFSLTFHKIMNNSEVLKQSTKEISGWQTFDINQN